ncbi:MAG: dihydrofolate reductase family protein [Acidimicrobiia bacterium]|nr:dihydrofolate reductase family protein [Acidimicrobiia bacterium]
MSKLIYSAITSLDGYVADADGNFEWAAPDDEVHRFVNELERPIGTYLYGRRMYDVMAAWESMDIAGDPSSATTEYANIWRNADKIVYSTTLTAVTSARTRLERRFDPAAVAKFKAASKSDLSVGGSHLAGPAIAAGLVDEYHQFVTPVVVGGGTHWLPDDVRLDLELVDTHRFAGGVVHLHYRTKP